MKITYDQKSDAKYIQIKKGTVAVTKQQNDWLIFDYDKSGEVVGIEILDARKHSLEVANLEKELIGTE